MILCVLQVDISLGLLNVVFSVLVVFGWLHRSTGRGSWHGEPLVVFPTAVGTRSVRNCTKVFENHRLIQSIATCSIFSKHPPCSN